MLAMLDASRLIGTLDVVFITMDTLRYDVAVQLHTAGRTPHLSVLLAPDGWEKLYTPGNFTFAAHDAFTTLVNTRYPRWLALLSNTRGD